MLALTACSGITLPTPERPTGGETGAPAAAEPADALPVELEAVREYWPLPDSDDYRVPNLVGKKLPEARDALAEWDAFIREYDASEEDRDIYMGGNWTVVSQAPLPGTPLGEHDRVELYVLKNDEAAEAVATTLADDSHVGERVFSGTVTGFDGIQTLLVDSAEVRLDLITPVHNSCGLDATGNGASADYTADVSALVPVGTEVLAVRSDVRGDEGFLHIRTAEHPWPSPPLESVNENLVRSGWWMPYTSDFGGGFHPPSEGIVFSPFVENTNLTSVQAEYAPLIAQAGNTAVVGSVAGLGVCRSVAEQDAVAWAAAREETDRRIREVEAELQRRTEAGYYTCRDGDGDGVCYER